MGFLEKPLSREKVLLALKNALEQSSLRVENDRLRELAGANPKMIGSSPVWTRVVEQGFARRTVRCSCSVMW
jgi:two-component system nitrogen regulation response regulator NtrX